MYKPRWSFRWIGPAALLASVGAAGAAAWGTFQILGALQSEMVDAAAEEPFEIEVVAAVADLPVGHIIVADDLESRATRAEYLADGVLTDPVDIVGRTAVHTILAGEPVRAERLAPRDAAPGLHAVVPEGLRALSINISGGGQVSGFIEPGNRVDVLVTLWPPPGQHNTLLELETVTLLEAVMVLAIDDRTAESERRGVKLKPQVTLAMAPDLAERITHALSTGRVKLALRGDTDLLTFATRGEPAAVRLGGSGRSERLSVVEWRERAARDPTTLTVIGGAEVTESAP